MSIVAGDVRCQIVVTESSGRIGSFAFILRVQLSALPTNSDLSESDYQYVEEMIEAAENRPGFIKADWCGERECEDALKEKAGVSSRCIPLSGNEMLTGKCVCCGKDAKTSLYWGKAY